MLPTSYDRKNFLNEIPSIKLSGETSVIERFIKNHELIISSTIDTSLSLNNKIFLRLLSLIFFFNKFKYL